MGRTQVQAVAEVFSDNALATFDAYDRGGINVDHPAIRFKSELLGACNSLIIRVGRLAIKQAADTMCSRRIAQAASNNARAATSFNTTAARRAKNANSNLSEERSIRRNMQTKFPAWNPPPKRAEDLYISKPVYCTPTPVPLTAQQLRQVESRHELPEEWASFEVNYLDSDLFCCRSDASQCLAQACQDNTKTDHANQTSKLTTQVGTLKRGSTCAYQLIVLASLSAQDYCHTQAKSKQRRSNTYRSASDQLLAGKV